MEDTPFEKFLSNPGQFDYCRDDDDDDEDKEDLNKNPEYNLFCKNLRENGDGQSYTVEIPISSGISVILRYDYEEKEEGSFENVYRKRNLKSCSEKVNAKVPVNLGGFSSEARPETPETVKKSLKIGHEESGNKVRDIPGEEIKSPDDENEPKEVVEVESVPCKSRGEPSRKMNSVFIDESWAQFLASLNKPGKNMELSYESDHTSTHQKNDGSCSDVEIIALDEMLSREGDHTAFVPSKCYQSLPGEECWDGIRSSSESQFREKLMDLLKTPYNQQEFENLWREVTYRKPVQGLKDLRHGRMKPYSTKTDGKSYLDWYEELRKKIDEFRHDRCKILYLLRGFFFWLENTAHEGAFQPWLDSLYLNALSDQKLYPN